jgi:hypothetical protein
MDEVKKRISARKCNEGTSATKEKQKRKSFRKNRNTYTVSTTT